MVRKKNVFQFDSLHLLKCLSQIDFLPALHSVLQESHVMSIGLIVLLHIWLGVGLERAIDIDAKCMGECVLRGLALLRGP